MSIKELARLMKFFDNPPVALDAMKPLHVRQYLTWRTSAKVRANREKALLSHIWNYARDKGYTSLSNPCVGIKGYIERGRDVYVSDADYAALWDTAIQPLRDTMDMAYLTGQLPADVLKITEHHIIDDAIKIREEKTGAKFLISLSADLLAVVQRICARKQTYKVYNMALIVNEQGRKLSKNMLRTRFDAARIQVGRNVSVSRFESQSGYR